MILTLSDEAVKSNEIFPSLITGLLEYRQQMKRIEWNNLKKVIGLLFGKYPYLKE